ncbi:hypothetical protein CEE45_01545 [Candidatus Heimdallarchaeota archaeon B3_Heim]|nr:MAG: hypothetical protein CEE45_01545 [Candidatus Heimdallarchaeota archaeon B3_Heim]
MGLLKKFREFSAKTNFSRTNFPKVKKAFAFLLFLVFAVQIVAFGSFFTLNLTTNQAFAVKYEETDIQQFLDSDIRNVTVILADASAVGSGARISSPMTLTLDRIAIRASTLPYHPKAFPTSSRMLHNIFPTSESIARFATLRSSLGGGGASFQSIESIKSIDAVNALLSLAEDTNATSESVGENTVSDEKFAVEDLKAETEYNINTTAVVTDLTSQIGYLENQSVESAYQDYASFLYSNDSVDAIAGSEADEEKNHDLLISGFDNTEDAVLSILKSNIAADYSTASNILTADDVTVVDYAVHHANMTNYLSSALVEKVRDAVTDYEDSLEANIAATIFGFKIYTAKAATTAGILAGFRSAVGRVISFGQAVVSTPLREVKKIGGSIKRTVTSYASKVGEAGSSALNIGKGFLTSALSKLGSISKSIGDKVGSFAQNVKVGVTGAVKGVKGFVSKSFNAVLGSVKSLFSFIPMLILLMVGGVGAVLVVIFLMNRKRAPPEVMPY